MSLLPADALWVDTDHKLRECCDALQQHRAIAVDTEFMRSDTFFPKAALFQLASPQQIYLIDPLALTDLAPLRQLFSEQSITKVLHACSEDLEVFNTFLGVLPEPMIDTQIAAAMVNLGPSLGYAALVKQSQGIELSKEETRSNWLQRPLTETQKVYAAQDVAYLLPVYEMLKAHIDEQQRWQWLQADCDELVANAKAPVDHHGFYPRIKSAWKLNRQQLAVLAALSAWREQSARENDQPRNHLVHEKVLWDIAFKLPRTMPELQALGGLSPRKLRLYGDTLLSLVEHALNQDPDNYPPRLPGPLPIALRHLLTALKETVARRARELDLPAEVLVKKNELDFIVRSGMNRRDFELPPRLLGWRKEAIGDALLDTARAFSESQQETAADHQEVTNN